MAPYEFYREKAWQCSHALAYLAEETQYTTNRETLARKLRSVVAELTRAADLLDGITDDTITFFDENKNTEERDYQKES